jgi:hypothetical protein
LQSGSFDKRDTCFSVDAAARVAGQLDRDFMFKITHLPGERRLLLMQAPLCRRGKASFPATALK